MRAEIISVGTELLLGEITDTNASFLAGQLPVLGIDLYWISQVGDNRTRLVEVLRRAWQRSDLILITGGLGPTEDDLTREAIAEMLGEKLEVIPALEGELRGFFARRGIEMPVANIKQATLIPSAEVIHNIHGTAPGWRVVKDKHILIAMPGPPREMQPMWHQEILPRLRQGASGATIVSKTIKTFGLTEAAVDEWISSLLSSANPTLGVYAKVDGIHLRLTVKAQSQGRHMLAEKGLSLAVMEDFTGGLLTATITNAPDAAKYFKGGLIAYSNEVLVTYGVDTKLIAKYGGASAEVVQAMAEAARLRLGAAIGVGVTGSDEPSEIERRPFSVVYIGIDDGKSKRAITDYFPWDRAWVKLLSISLGSSELRKTLATLG